MTTPHLRHSLLALVALCLCSLASAQTYTYDSLNRLTAVFFPNGGGQSYTYDAAGNLLSLSSTGTLPNVSLIVSRSGAGNGTVSGSGINCGSTCSASLAAGGTVTLVVSANSGSLFTGWSGDCTGFSACVLNMSTDHSVTATFGTDPNTTPPGPGDSSTITQILNVVAGWNLLGNGLSTAIDVADLGTESQIISVWKWQNTSARWAFFAPSLGAGDMAVYAQNKGYDVLTSIAPNEGFWLNAKQAGALFSQNGTAGGVVIDTLPKGWNLLSSGISQTPAEFNAGAAVQPGVSSVWAWDATQSKWLFYAPSLAGQGGTVLTDYLNSRGYLDFTATARKLTLGSGFWVNRP